MPYQEGALGAIEEESYADLLLVGGNPLEDSEKNLSLIMMDGEIYKNTL